MKYQTKIITAPKIECKPCKFAYNVSALNIYTAFNAETQEICTLFAAEDKVLRVNKTIYDTPASEADVAVIAIGKALKQTPAYRRSKLVRIWYDHPVKGLGRNYRTEVPPDPSTPELMKQLWEVKDQFADVSFTYIPVRTNHPFCAIVDEIVHKAKAV